MGRLLEQVDQAIDANAIIFQRCLDCVVGIVGQRVTPQFYGPEADPAASEGTLNAAVAIFHSVKEVLDLPAKELIEEYTTEIEDQRRMAREKRADVQQVGDVTVGGSQTG